MQDVFIKQTVYRLSQIQEAELVIPEEKDYNIGNSQEVNDEKDLAEPESA